MVDVVGTLGVALLWYLVFTVATRRFDAVERPYLWAALGAHLFSAVAMVLLTREVLGGGDMFGYAAFGRFVGERLLDDPGGILPLVIDMILRRDTPVPFPNALEGSATGVMQGLSVFFMLSTANSITASGALIAGAACLAKVAIYSTLRDELPGVQRRTLLVTALLVPSAVYWSSGLLKEPIASVGLGMLVSGGFAFATRRSMRSLALMTLGVVLVGLLKPYWLPPFGLSAAAWYIARAIRSERAGLGRLRLLLTGSAVALAGILLTGNIFPEVAVENLEEEIEQHQEVGARTGGGSNYQIGDEGAPGSRLAQAPFALLTALFRPALFEARSVLMFVNAIETTAIALYLLKALLEIGPRDMVARVRARPALLFCFAFTVTLGVGVGLATTNLGSLSRYRIPFMPFFATLLAAMGQRRLTATEIGRHAPPVDEGAPTRAASAASPATG